MESKDLIKQYAKAYYVKNREKLLKQSNQRYKKRGTTKCKACGADISKLQKSENGHIQYCNKCILDKNKTSRQTRWYRANRFKLQIQRRKGEKK